MLLGRAIAAAVASLTVRQQIDSVIPEGYCNPQCPECKSTVTDPFDYDTACQQNSSFLTNCGSCQLCIWTYAIENPDLPNMSYPEDGLQTLLNLCLNTTANDDVVGLQSQISRISEIGVALTSGHTPTTTYSETTITRTGSSGTWTVTALARTSSWTTILSTADWASYYYSHQSAESAASVASAAAARNNATATGLSTITPAPVMPTASSSSEANEQPLNKSWVIGPVIGSVLGVFTVAVVIYFTRRKHKIDALAVEAAKDIKEEDDESSRESTLGKSQLHADSVVLTELESTEVYEMAAAEPVGSELNTPSHGTMDFHEDWPLPISPLPLLFAMTELRDERAGNNNSPKHETYYHS